MKKVRLLELDVHAETIAVAIAEPNGDARSLGIIPNREEPIRKLPARSARFRGRVRLTVAAAGARPWSTVLHLRVPRQFCRARGRLCPPVQPPALFRSTST
jgi:hypothetical protein